MSESFTDEAITGKALELIANDIAALTNGTFISLPDRNRDVLATYQEKARTALTKERGPLERLRRMLYRLPHGITGMDAIEYRAWVIDRVDELIAEGAEQSMTHG